MLDRAGNRSILCTDGRIPAGLKCGQRLQIGPRKGVRSRVKEGME